MLLNGALCEQAKGVTVGIDDLEKLVGYNATAVKLLLPGESQEQVMSRSGVLRFAHLSSFGEYDLLFDSGDRITLIPGDTVTADNKCHVML